MNINTLKTKTFWVAIVIAVFNVVASQLNVNPQIVNTVNGLLAGTGLYTMSDAISKVQK